MSLVAASSLVPMVGIGLSLYLGLLAWAVLGFRWWLASLPFTALLTLPSSLPQTTAVGVGAATIVQTMLPQASAAQLQTWLILEVVSIVIYPTVLYLGQRSLRKEVVKRIGRSRFPK